MAIAPSGGAITLSTQGDLDPIDETRGLIVYRLVQEALTDVARHSSATNVSIAIERPVTMNRIQVMIADNGRGADLGSSRGRLGLLGMRERVSSVGGELTLVSSINRGFTVMASLPLPVGAA